MTKITVGKFDLTFNKQLRNSKTFLEKIWFCKMKTYSHDLIWCLDIYISYKNYFNCFCMFLFGVVVVEYYFNKHFFNLLISINIFLICCITVAIVLPVPTSTGSLLYGNEYWYYRRYSITSTGSLLYEKKFSLLYGNEYCYYRRYSITSTGALLYEKKYSYDHQCTW